MPPSSPQRRTRLRHLARDAGVDLSEPAGQLCPSLARKPVVVASKDRHEAHRLINEAARKGRTLSIFHRYSGFGPPVYKPEHVAKALSDHVQTSGSAPVARALIDLLQASTGGWTSGARGDFFLQSKLLTVAARSKDVDLVNVLAPHAGEEELSAALKSAIESNNHRLQSVLLKHGADPNCLRDHLIRSITSNDPNLASVVRALLSDRERLRPQVFAECLSAAIQAENTTALTSLLKMDVVVRRSKKGSQLENWSRDRLLHTTIQRQQYIAFATIAYHTTTHALYDSDLYDRVVHGFRDRPDLATRMTETLLCLDTLDECRCARKFWQRNSVPFDKGIVDASLLELLLSYGIPVSGQAFRLAGELGRLDLFRGLLKNDVENARAMWDSTKLLPPEVRAIARNEAIDKLVVASIPSPGWAHDALIYATSLDRPDLITHFLSRGGLVNHNNGEAVKLAVQNQNMTVFELLMARTLRSEIAAEVINLIQPLRGETRLAFVKSFLQQPDHVPLATCLLDDILLDQPENRDVELLSLLIDYGVQCTGMGMAVVIDNAECEMLHRFLAIQDRSIYHQDGNLRNAPAHFPRFVCSSMSFLVDRLPRIYNRDARQQDLRQLCFQMLDLHIRLEAVTSRSFRLEKYFDLRRVFKNGPVDCLLVNLFGKYQRHLPLAQQTEITGVIVCSQPPAIARGFTQRLCAHTSAAGSSIDSSYLIMQIGSHEFADDAEKTSMLAYLFRFCSGTPLMHTLSAQCLEVHLRSLANATNHSQWPTDTVRFLLRRHPELDNHFYACIRVAALHEQTETLEHLFKPVPSTQYVGGDLLRPLIRYHKMESLRYLLESHWISPSLTKQVFDHARGSDSIDIAVLSLTYGTAHCDGTDSGCLLEAILSQDKAFIESLIVDGQFSAKNKCHVWTHLNPQPRQREKYETLAVLVQSQPSRPLVQQLFVKAAESGDMDLCRLVLTNGTSHLHDSSDDGCCTTRVLPQPSSTVTLKFGGIDEATIHAVLKSAVEKGNLDICKLLLDYGASIDYQNCSLLRSVIESNTSRELDILELILAHGPTDLRPRVLNECLWRAAVFNKRATCAWLLRKGASLRVKGYACLRIAADRGLTELLQIFVEQRLPQDALRAAFESSHSTVLRNSVPHDQRLQVTRTLLDAGVQDPDTLSEALIHVVQEPSPSVALVKLLLERGASVIHRQSQCLIKTWRAGHLSLLKLLCEGYNELPAAPHCFRQACADYYRSGPKDVDILEVVALIAGLGVPQLILDAEFASALERSVSAVSKKWNMRLVHLLMERSATLDPASAKSLYHACLSGDEEFVRKAMRHGVSQDTRVEALKILFAEESQGPERDVSCMKVLFSLGDVTNAIDCDTVIAMLKSILRTRKMMPLIYGLLARRRSRMKKNDCLGRTLCENPERFRGLVDWAIIQPCQEVSSSCLSGLIRCVFLEEELDIGAFMGIGRLTTVMWASNRRSLLLLALKHGRPSLIPVMLHFGACPDVKDENGKSALCLAIEKRYVRAADSIFSAGTHINDGSLHAAACVQDLDMIRRLREQGHTATSRPASYNGRTVLEAFLRHEHSDEKKLSATMKAFTGGIEKPGLWVASPGHLWVALRSKTPYAMTAALLENMPRQKRHVDDVLLWKGMYISVLSWALKDKCPHLSPRFKPQLVQRLEAAGFERIFYAADGPQPEDAIGVPQFLLEKENDRQRRQAFREKDCAVCGDRPEEYTSIHARLNPSCAATHSWKDEIVCTDCVIGHITAQIFPDGIHSYARSTPRCWAPKCCVTLSHEDVKRYIDPVLFEQYDEKLTLQLLHSNSQSARCAASGCHGGAWFSNADLEELTFFRCPVCQQLTCLQCNSLYEPSHLQAPCPAGLKRKRDEEDEQSDETVKKISKECGCGARIQKTDGCDHMTCKRCGREWCWVCLVPYEQIRDGDNSAHLPTCTHYRPGGRRRR